jgi:hypothetical protein
MLHELLELQANRPLCRLLSHYAQPDANGQRVWRDRVMELEGVDAAGLVKLHGQLITSEWIDLNIGAAAFKETRKVGGCYRATPSGIRALSFVAADSGGDVRESVFVQGKADEGGDSLPTIAANLMAAESAEQKAA